MTIRLLGTGAAEGIPAFYSNSAVSAYARQHGGKNVRTRSSALVDGQIKLDLPPDTLVQLQRDQLDAMDWSAIVFTHSDPDHFAIEELQYSFYPFNQMVYAGFTIYGNATVCEMISARYPDWPFEFIETKSFEPIPHAEYIITPIRATHGDGQEDCHNLLIQDAQKSFLYATDTGVWEEPTWEFLSGVKLDGLVIECTEGYVPTLYEGHLSIEECIQVVQRLREMGILSSDTLVYTTHHSHLGEATHEILEKELRPYGIEPGYDGLVFSI